MATHQRVVSHSTYSLVSLKNYSYNFLIFPFVWLRKIKSGNSKQNAVVELLFYLIQLYFFYWLSCVLHTETYVFQSTHLANFLRPVKRSECKYAVHTLAEFNGDGKTRNSLLSGTAENSESSLIHHSSNLERKKKLSIGVLYLYDGSAAGGNGNDGGESWSEPLMSRVVKNRKEYCDRHGYHLINANHLIDRSRPAAWSKLTAIDNYLSVRDGVTEDTPTTQTTATEAENSYNNTNYKSENEGAVTYDYLLYIDMDVIIMNFDIKLEKFIYAVDDDFFTKKSDSSTKSPDFIMTEDWKGPNTGTWFVRNIQTNTAYPPIADVMSSSSSSSSSSPLLSPQNFPHWFLSTSWSQSQLLKKVSPSGKIHPFEYEQRAFHFLLDTPVWRDRNLERFRGEITVEEIRKHFVFFPQCSFNSYSLHPFDFRGDREISQYIQGDFLIHFAGKKGRKKLLLLEHYLKIAEEKLKTHSIIRIRD